MLTAEQGVNGVADIPDACQGLPKSLVQTPLSAASQVWHKLRVQHSVSSSNAKADGGVLWQKSSHWDASDFDLHALLALCHASLRHCRWDAEVSFLRTCVHNMPS